MSKHVGQTSFDQYEVNLGAAVTVTPNGSKVCFVIKNDVVGFLPLLTEAEDPNSKRQKSLEQPGRAKDPKMTTLRRGNDALGTRHLSHPRARNSVVLSTLLKVVLMNGIARKKRCTVATSSRRLMDVYVSQQTTEHINTVHRKPASTLLWGGVGHKRFSRAVLCLWLRELDYSSTVTNILRGLDEVICCRSPVQEIPWFGCCHQLVVLLWLCSVCLTGSR